MTHTPDAASKPGRIRGYPTVWPYWAWPLGALLCRITDHHRRGKWNLRHTILRPPDGRRIFCGRCRAWLADMEVKIS